MPIDGNGIYQYEESDTAAPFSDMLNRLAGSVSSRIAAVMSRLAAQDDRIAAVNQYDLAQTWVLRAESDYTNKSAGTAPIPTWTVIQNVENRFGFNTTNGTVTIPVAGLYMIDIRLVLSLGTAGGRMRLATSGDFIRFGQTIQTSNASNNQLCCTLNTTLPLPAGATFAPSAYASVAGTNMSGDIEVRRIG